MHLTNNLAKEFQLYFLDTSVRRRMLDSSVNHNPQSHLHYRRQRWNSVLLWVLVFLIHQGIALTAASSSSSSGAQSRGGSLATARATSLPVTSTTTTDTSTMESSSSSSETTRASVFEATGGGGAQLKDVVDPAEVSWYVSLWSIINWFFIIFIIMKCSCIPCAQ
jgi:hypothetical protein